jgi:superoxide dismutase, Fe-Mn family
MFTLPSLPYEQNALAPHMSEKTLNFHYGKHHATYVDTLNALVKSGPMSEMTLEELILETQGQEDDETRKIFNNAAQCWNHEFFWNSMTPDGGGQAFGEIKRLIELEFGSEDAFKDAFRTAAKEHFGSGWCWLVLSNAQLDIITTHDAELPLTQGATALLTCDLWEHAYYLDYQNARMDFVDAYLVHLINWEFANENLAREMVE